MRPPAPWTARAYFRQAGSSLTPRAPTGSRSACEAGSSASMQLRDLATRIVSALRRQRCLRYPREESSSGMRLHRSVLTAAASDQTLKSRAPSPDLRGCRGIAMSWRAPEMLRRAEAAGGHTETTHLVDLDAGQPIRSSRSKFRSIVHEFLVAAGRAFRPDARIDHGEVVPVRVKKSRIGGRDTRVAVLIVLASSSSGLSSSSSPVPCALRDGFGLRRSLPSARVLP